MMTDQGSAPDMPAPAPLTEDELAALEARARAARSGPWTAVMAGALVPGPREAPDCEIRTRDTENPDLGSWTVSWDSRHTGWYTNEAHPAYGLAHADAAYLAAAANAVPALLAEVRQCRREIASAVPTTAVTFTAAMAAVQRGATVEYPLGEKEAVQLRMLAGGECEARRRRADGTWTAWYSGWDLNLFGRGESAPGWQIVRDGATQRVAQGEGTEMQGKRQVHADGNAGPDIPAPGASLHLSRQVIRRVQADLYRIAVEEGAPAAEQRLARRLLRAIWAIDEGRGGDDQ